MIDLIASLLAAQNIERNQLRSEVERLSAIVLRYRDLLEEACVELDGTGAAADQRAAWFRTASDKLIDVTLTVTYVVTTEDGKQRIVAGSKP